MRQFIILLVSCVTVLMSSCKDEVQSEDDWKNSALCYQLIGTSWQRCSSIIYSKDGSVAYENNDISPYIHTFTNREVNNEDLTEHKHRYALEVYNVNTKETEYGNWYIIDNRTLHAWCAPSSPYGEVISISSDYFEIRTDYDYEPITGDLDYKIEIYKSATIGGNSGNGSGNNNGNDNEGYNSIQEKLCENNGLWIYNHSYTYVIGGNTQYAQNNDFVHFRSDNEIWLQADWQCQVKSGASFRTMKSTVEARGTYRVSGEYLICEFSDVSCSGNSDLITKYWNGGVSNTKKYKVSFDFEGDLLLESGEESYRFNQDYLSGGNGGNGGGSSNHHYPCKSCDESGKCWNCNGKGINPVTNKQCNTCHGNGKCQICHGKGYIIV